MPLRPGRAIVGEDCDDANPDVSPGAVDVCNGVDDDCDTRIDEGAEELWHFGDGIAEAACVQLEGEPAPRCVMYSIRPSSPSAARTRNPPTGRWCA